ncbi:MAG: ATP-binding protein [Bacteroidales bacterium]|nr:ATP-binding protein [Bacteroidales bacterium]MBN2747182.1 ATP-binding protein [Bacteroidales bacterium]
MTVTPELKQRILTALQINRKNFNGSDAKYAVTLGINGAQYSRIKRDDTDHVLSDANWISLARRLNVNLSKEQDWKIVKTPVFEFISAQLEICQKHGASSMLCDLSDIGKSETAKHYAATHKNAVYVDCSQVKSKQLLIRFIAKEFGVGSNGRYADVYADLVFYIKTLPDPIIILDEYGDISYEALLESKALWNAVSQNCAFYTIGADGLQETMRRGIAKKKVGYVELFSRYGKKYGKVVPHGEEDARKLLIQNASMIIKGNSTANVSVVLKGIMGEDGRPSLRRIKNELLKVL